MVDVLCCKYPVVLADAAVRRDLKVTRSGFSSGFKSQERRGGAQLPSVDSYSVVHSHWSRNVEACLSLVESVASASSLMP